MAAKRQHLREPTNVWTNLQATLLRISVAEGGGHAGTLKAALEAVKGEKHGWKVTTQAGVSTEGPNKHYLLGKVSVPPCLEQQWLGLGALGQFDTSQIWEELLETPAFETQATVLSQQQTLCGNLTRVWWGDKQNQLTK